jgi:hypothetical protein
MMRLRKLKAEAELSELDLKIRKGELISLREVTEAMDTIIIEARNRLLWIPANLAPYLAAETTPAACQELVDSEIRSALTDLANSKFSTRPIRKGKRSNADRKKSSSRVPRRMEASQEADSPASGDAAG